MQHGKMEARRVWNRIQFLARSGGAAGTHTSGHWHPSLTKPRKIDGLRRCVWGGDTVVVVNCDVVCILHATTHGQQPQDKPKPFPSPDSGKTNAPRGRERNSSRLGGVNGASVCEGCSAFSLGWLSCDAIASAHSDSYPTQHQIQKGEASVRQLNHHRRRERGDERA